LEAKAEGVYTFLWIVAGSGPVSTNFRKPRQHQAKSPEAVAFVVLVVKQIPARTGSKIRRNKG